jgi:hydrogenase-4 component E
MTQLLLLLVVLTNFAVLGSSRLSACIRAIAVQGALLGLLPWLIEGEATAHVLRSRSAPSW